MLRRIGNLMPYIGNVLELLSHCQIEVLIFFPRYESLEEKIVIWRNKYASMTNKERIVLTSCMTRFLYPIIFPFPYLKTVSRRPRHVRYRRELASICQAGSKG